MSKILSKFFLLLLSWLGLSSCLVSPAAEYGCPHADFRLDGTVTDAESAEPLQGIQIVFQRDTTYSQEDGSWVISTDGVPFPSTYYITATDIDGIENGGLFEPDTVSISPIKTSSGSGWYTGTLEQHDIVIELDKSES